MKKIILLVMVASISILLYGCGKNNTADYQVTPTVSGTQSQKISFDIIKDGYSLGSKDAKVTIVEFSDFQCPACGQMYKVMKNVTQAYPNDVRLVYRNFPLSYHQYATRAALAAEAAGLQGKYWEMHDFLFENQNKLNDNIFAEFAQQLGLDIERFNKDRESSILKDKIQADLDQGQNSLSIGGTPTFYINNIEYTGQYTFAGLKKEIDSLLQIK